MRFRYTLIFLTAFLILSSLILPSQTQGQSSCSAAAVLSAVDVLAAERLIASCNGISSELLGAAQAAIDSTQDFAEIARYRTILALANAQAKNYFDARIGIQQALLDWRTANVPIMEGRTLYYSGKIFYDAGLIDQAFNFYSAAMNAARRSNDTFTQGRVTLVYGRHELGLGNNENAMGMLVDSLPLLLQNPTIAVPEQIENLTLLSRVYDIFEKYALAGFHQSQASFLRTNQDWYSEVVGEAGLSECPFEALTVENDILTVEHELANCVLVYPALRDSLLAALEVTREAAPRAHLQTLAGLVYYASGDYYNASVMHERALLLYRDAADRGMEGWTLYYMARAYYARGQAGNVPTFLGQSETSARQLNDVFQLGRVKLLRARYEVNENGDYGTAALIAEEGLQNLQGAGEAAVPEQIEVLDLLNQIYSALGNLERSGQYLRLAQGLRGNTLTDDGASSLVYVNTCQVNHLVNQLDIIYIERQLQLCHSNLPGLVLTAETMVLTADNPRLKGIAQLYVGMGHYFRRDVQFAYETLDRAVALLRQVGDPGLLGYAYYYLALNEFDKYQLDAAATYYDTARRNWETANDSFNLGRVYLKLGLWESQKANYNLAVTHLERALANIQTSPVYSLEEQATALSELVSIYREHLQNEQRTLEYQQQLESLYSRSVLIGEPTPAPVVESGTESTVSTGATEPVSDACNPRGIVIETDLIVAEKALAKCPQQLEELLFLVESARQQAATEADIAHTQNFLGIVYYYMGNSASAIIEHNRALTRYRNLGDAFNEGRSLFYAARSYQANNKPNEATTYFSQAQRVAINGGDARILAMIAMIFGNQAYAQRNMDEALKQYEFAVQQLEQVNDTTDMISTMVRIAQLHDERSNFEVAVDYYNRVIELAEEAGDSSSFVLASIGLARNHKYFGRYEAASALIEAAEEAADDPTSEVIARLERNDLARYLEDYETARDVTSINANSYDCQTGDLVRLYTAYYYVSVGLPGNALEQVRPILEPETCPERIPLMVAHAYAAEAEAQLSRRRSDQLVIDAINEAIREYDRLNYPRGYQSARIQMATYYFYLREYAESEKWLSTAERKAVEINDLRAQSDIAMVRVEISIDRGRYSEALTMLERASDLYNRLRFVPGLSATLEQRLRIYLDQARYDEAIEVIEFSRENYSDISISFDSRIAFYQGRYYEQIGQSELALTYYDQSLAGFEESGEVLSVVDVQLQKARVLQRRGQYEEALELISKLRPLVAEQESNFHLGQIDAALGDNYVLSWSADANRTSTSEAIRQAQQAYRQAIENYTVVNNVAGLARVNNSVGELELLLFETSLTEPQRYKVSNASIHRSLELYRIIGNSLGVADALYNLGRFSLLAREYNTAEGYFYQSLNEVGDNDPLRRANILTSLGLTYEYKHAARNLGFGVASNDLFLAVEKYRDATRLLSFAYAEIEDDSTQRNFGTQNQTLAPYNRLLRIYAVYTLKDKEADAIEALRYAEESRARSYLTQLQGEQLTVGDAEENSTLTEWQTLRSEVVNLSQLLREINQRSGDAAETGSIQEQIADYLARMQVLEGEMQLSSLQQFISIQVSDLATIQAALPDDTLFVSYYMLPAEITPQGEEAARVLTLLISKDGISKTSQRVVDYRQEMLNQIEGLLRFHSPSAASQLYRLLIAPIASELAPYENLVIVPHGVLNYIPFEALSDTQGQPIVMAYNINYVPSATVYTLLRETVKPAEGTGNLLGLGYSGAAQNLPPLSYYSDELYGIEAVVDNSALYMEDEATEATLDDLGEADMIHIAAHGRFDSLNPLSSFIALAPGDEQDGLLEVREVYQLSLRERNPLITLSACELAISQINPGDELEGMTRAFLLTGARGVIASMWPVDDFVTAELMQAFYQNRADGMTNAQALTAAKRMIQDNYGDTYLWAGFVLIGLEN